MSLDPVYRFPAASDIETYLLKTSSTNNYDEQEKKICIELAQNFANQETTESGIYRTMGPSIYTLYPPDIYMDTSAGTMMKAVGEALIKCAIVFQKTNSIK